MYVEYLILFDCVSFFEIAKQKLVILFCKYLQSSSQLTSKILFIYIISN